MGSFKYCTKEACSGKWLLRRMHSVNGYKFYADVRSRCAPFNGSKVLTSKMSALNQRRKGQGVGAYR